MAVQLLINGSRALGHGSGSDAKHLSTYAKFSFLGVKHKTDTVERSACPQWGAAFSLALPPEAVLLDHPGGFPLQVSVWQRRRAGRSRCIGSVTVPLDAAAAYQGVVVDSWLPLEAPGTGATLMRPARRAIPELHVKVLFPGHGPPPPPEHQWRCTTDVRRDPTHAAPCQQGLPRRDSNLLHGSHPSIECLVSQCLLTSDPSLGSSGQQRDGPSSNSVSGGDETTAVPPAGHTSAREADSGRPPLLPRAPAQPPPGSIRSRLPASCIASLQRTPATPT